MKTLIALLFFLVPVMGRAGTVSIGGTSLELPAPPGYAVVTPQMTTVYDLEKRFVGPDNQEFAAFIAEADVPAALRGEVVSFQRRFSVQTVRTIVGATTSKSDFAQLGGLLKTQNAEILAKAQRELPAQMAKTTDGLAKDYDLKLALSVAQMVPYPAHEEAEHKLAYSMMVRYDAKRGSEPSTQDVSAVTTTLVQVKGKILFLYCFAEEAGLDWSRQISRQWSDAVLTDNPSSGTETAKNEVVAAMRGFSWNGLGASTITGAGIGLVVGLVAVLFRRKKSG